jgi:Na+/H+-dicarboxylate symporter
MTKKKHKRPWGVFFAIILAVLIGTWIGPTGSKWGIPFLSIFDTLSKVFLNALTLVVVPLVSSSIISGIARIGGEEEFGRIGAKTFSFYIGTSLLAIFIGLFFVNVINPGGGQIIVAGTPQVEMLENRMSSHQGQAVADILHQIVPSNIVNAFANGQMLGIIFFCILFGYAVSKITPGPSAMLQGFFQGIFQAMLRITHIIMKFLPYGVFCLIAKVFITTGFNSLASVSLFMLTVILGLLVYSCIALPLLLKFVAKVKPSRHFRAMSPALVTAFSTSSSSASLPVTINCVEKRAGVSNRICSLVVPLGTSVNMSGSALYECVAAMFVAQAYGIHMSVVSQFLVVALSLVTSIGVAGIPSASIIAIMIILKTIGLPLEGIGLFLAVDRLLDMCRTTVNVFSDSCCAVLVARSEGEKDVLTQTPSEMPYV